MHTSPADDGVLTHGVVVLQADTGNDVGTRAFAVHVPTEDDAGRAAGTVALVDGLACSVETGHWASRREIGY